MAQNQNSTKLGALWVNQPKSEKGPVLTGEIEGKRVALFKNKKWTEAESKKQPMYYILESVFQGKAQKA
ncbi:MAG: hypothetical protein WC508_04970 [Patescibacteria group bacterium]